MSSQPPQDRSGHGDGPGPVVWPSRPVSGASSAPPPRAPGAAAPGPRPPPPAPNLDGALPWQPDSRPPPPAPSVGPYRSSFALRYGVDHLTGNAGAAIMGSVVLVGAWYLVVQAVGAVLPSPPAGFDEVLDRGWAGHVLALWSAMSASAVHGMFVRFGAAVVAGRQAGLRSFFTTRRLSDTLLVAVAAGAAAWMVGFIPAVGGALSIVVVFLAGFAHLAVVDGDVDAGPALVTAIGLVQRHPARMLGLASGSALVLLGGALLCGVGALPAASAVAISQAWAHRHLQGLPIAP